VLISMIFCFCDAQESVLTQNIYKWKLLIDHTQKLSATETTIGWIPKVI